MQISKEDLQKILEELWCGLEQREKSAEDLDTIAKKVELRDSVEAVLEF